MSDMTAARTADRTGFVRGRGAAGPASVPADERTGEKRGDGTAPDHRGAGRRSAGGDAVSGNRGARSATARCDPRSGGTLADRDPCMMPRNRNSMTSHERLRKRNHRCADAFFPRPARPSGRDGQLASNGSSRQMHAGPRAERQREVTSSCCRTIAGRAERSGPLRRQGPRQGTERKARMSRTTPSPRHSARSVAERIACDQRDAAPSAFAHGTGWHVPAAIADSPVVAVPRTALRPGRRSRTRPVASIAASFVPAPGSAGTLRKTVNAMQAGAAEPAAATLTRSRGVKWT